MNGIDTSLTIAVDLDDVLGQTNQAVANWHNERHGTKMTLNDFHYYHYWKNPYWGTPIETHHKVTEFYKTDLMQPAPVPGALEGMRKLQEMGYRLVLVTARHVTEEDKTKVWLDQYYPNTFDKLIFTGQFRTDSEGKNVLVKVGKAEICHGLGIKVLIDDSVETALACAKAEPRVHVLLFGDYGWNQRESKLEESKDHMSYEERLAYENGREWWKDEHAVLPDRVERVKDWTAVVRWVEDNRALI